jgi:predicted metal-binding protein
MNPLKVFCKPSSEKPANAIEEIPVPWSSSVLMVCTKCGKRLADEKLANTPEEWRRHLKSLARTNQKTQGMRVVNTSCLGPCPENRIAMTLGQTGFRESFKAFTVDPKTSPTEIFNEVILKNPGK